MGEAKKAIQFAIKDDDEELIQLIREFNKRKEDKLIQEESARQQEALANRKMNDNRISQSDMYCNVCIYALPKKIPNNYYRINGKSP